MDTKQIACPNCGALIDVDNLLAVQLEAGIRKQMDAEYKEKDNALYQKEKTLMEREKSQGDMIAKKLQERETSLREELTVRLKTDFEQKLTSLTQDIEKKTLELSNLKDKEIELEKLKREKSSLEKDYELKLEKEKTRIQKETEEKIGKLESEKHALELKEKDKKIEDAKKQVAELERKLKQGSMQLQGEVQELAIEDVLHELFPKDEVKPVPKGRPGADSILHIKSSGDHLAGKIIYESKRTKSFSNSWIEKLKNDQRGENADLAVLVTEALPAGIESIGMLDDVWICSFNFLAPLSLILHDSILRIHGIRNIQKNSGDKMQLLYDYLTSNEFKMQLEAIIQGFLQIKQSIDKERLTMERIWKEREKQLEKVLTNTTHFYASVKGIAGAGIPEIPMFNYYEQDSEDQDSHSK